VDGVTRPALVVLAAGRARRYGGLKPLASVGADGSAVIDLLGGDAVAGGFGRLVLVISPETGPQIRAHVEATWPSSIDVTFAVQDRPLGTVHAVLAAASAVDKAQAFAVSNADDLYGRSAMSTLAAHLAVEGSTSLVGFRLERAITGDEPVTRGICTVRDGRLVRIVERRQVQRTAAGIVARDGREPAALSGDDLVSMNLWGFAPEIWARLEDEMARAVTASEEAEVLLPEFVGRHLDRGEIHVTVLSSDEECLGVTHPSDLELVQRRIADQVAKGLRPSEAFG
jgi:dTDP-glucose pyrophosphorylase